MGQYKKLWYLLIAVLVVTFSILGYFGSEVYRQAPLIPQQYVSADGQVVMTRDDILQGQSAWQTTGGMQLGSILGHGAYQAPDWTADWLHREAEAWLNISAEREFGKAFADLDDVAQLTLKNQLVKEYRSNRMDDNGTVTLSAARTAAIANTANC